MPRAAGKPAPPAAPVALRAAEVGRLLGFAVDPAEIERALGSLGFAVARRSGTSGRAGDTADRRGLRRT